MDGEEARCASCGALLAQDAEWCGQCFQPVRRPESEPVAAPLSAVKEPKPVEKKQAYWPCPTCESQNPIELDACSACGTPFGALFKSDEKLPDVAPRDAIIRSLMFPGLGHKMVGRGLDGLARAALFWWMFLTTILILISRVSSGPMLGMLALFGIGAIAIYLFTALEAGRMARGYGPITSSRTLLWVAVGMVITSVLMAGLIIAAAASR